MPVLDAHGNLARTQVARESIVIDTFTFPVRSLDREELLKDCIMQDPSGRQGFAANPHTTLVAYEVQRALEQRDLLIKNLLQRIEALEATSNESKEGN